jgi:hypothetical protein
MHSVRPKLIPFLRSSTVAKLEIELSFQLPCLIDSEKIFEKLIGSIY